MSNICILNIVIAKVWGGGEQYVYDTAQSMVKQGVKVYIAVDKNNTAMQQRFAEVAEVISFNLYTAFGIFALNDLIEFIKKQKVNIINCHSGHAMQLCMLLKMFTGIKLVMFKHNALPAKHDFYHFWQRKYTDAFICVSKLVYNFQTYGLSDAEKQKFHLIYNGIDIGKFNKYKTVYKDPNKFIVGYAGRIAGNKGIDVLLKAFLTLSKKYNNIYLQLAGNNDGYLREVQQFIINNKLQDRVEYLGCLKDMELFYKKLDLFILPSIVKEAFGLVLCEAMYCGVPVITTDSGAQTEIIKNGVNGYIIKKNNVDILIKKIIDIYEDNVCVSDVVKNAKINVENNFDINKCVLQIINVLELLNFKNHQL